MLLPNTIRTVAALVTGTLVYMAFNPSTPLRIIVFGVLAGLVFYGGWWFAEYLTVVEEHDLHIDEQFAADGFAAVAAVQEHRSDWHYLASPDVEVCELDGNDCPTFEAGR